MRFRSFLFACLAGGTILAPYALCSSGSISGSPNPCNPGFGQTTCTTNVGWNAFGTSSVSVWVSMDGGAEVLFAGGAPSGSQDASWIQLGHSYVFRLQDTDFGAWPLYPTLATVTVTAAVIPPSLTFSNSSNTGIGVNFVVGDSWQLTVSNGAPNAPVTVNWYNIDGQYTVMYTAGTTNGNGALYTSAPVYASSIGRWTATWYVGGTQVGSTMNVEFIDAPYSLTVQSVSAANPNCGGTTPNGIYISIKYQIVGQTGASMSAQTINLEPWELDTFYTTSGGVFSQTSHAIGGPGTAWSPPSQQYALSTGMFYDIPVGACAAFPYLQTYKWSTQTISIHIGTKSYQVRIPTDWTSSAPAPQSGSIVNSYGDVSYSQ